MENLPPARSYKFVDGLLRASHFMTLRGENSGSAAEDGHHAVHSLNRSGSCRSGAGFKFRGASRRSTPARDFE